MRESAFTYCQHETVLCELAGVYFTLSDLLVLKLVVVELFDDVDLLNHDVTAILV